MKTKDKWLQVRVTEAEKTALNELAKKEDKPVSQIIRDVVKEITIPANPTASKSLALEK